MSLKDSIQRAMKKQKVEETKKKEEAGEDADVGDKIVFTGLDNSGKSSIILALQKKYSKIAVLQPTRQTERSAFSFLGKHITRWDLGGQQRYRIAYLKNPVKYFERTTICIFTIDIQNWERIDEAIEYFKDVIDAFKQLDIHPPVYVFLHKADPEWMRIVDDLQESYLSPIKRKIQEVAGNTTKLIFKITSIFDPWSILNSFSEMLQDVYPKGDLIDRSILEFAKKLKANGIVVMDHNALILGHYFKTPTEETKFAAITPSVLQLFEQFRLVQEKNQKMALRLSQGEYMFHVVTDPIRTEERYIFIKAPLSAITEDAINDFGNILIDLLEEKEK